MRSRVSIKSYIVGCILLLLLSQAVAAQDIVIYNRKSSATFYWNDDQTDIEYYEVILVRDGTGTIYGPYTTNTKSITISRPRSGVYEVRVRAVRRGLYSDWCSSLGNDARLQDGTPGKWKVRFQLLGPTGPIIIN